MAPPPPAAERPLPDWSLLPQDLLTHIVGALEIQYAFVAAAVSPRWRAAAVAVLGRAMFPRRVLWLVTTVPPRAGEASAVALLHDVFSRKSHRASLAGVSSGHRWRIIGSYRSWLLVLHGADQRSLSFVNPFTGTDISLPRIPSGQSPWKSVVSGDLSKGSYAVLLIPHMHCGELFATASGSQEWRSIECKLPPNDCIAYEGKFIVVDHCRTLRGWTIESAPRMVFEKPTVTIHGMVYEMGKFFLVSAPWGDLLLVVQQQDHLIDYKGSRRRWPVYTIFRIDLVKMEVEDERMVSLRGYTLIVDAKNCSLVSSECYPLLLPDSVFFSATFREVGCSSKWDAGFFDLKSRKHAPVPPSLELPASCKQHPRLMIPPEASL